MLIGRDPSGIDALMHDLQQTLHLFGRSGAVMYALSGVDIALWDIAGKVAGKPLYKLLGGADRALPAYASLLRCSGPDAVAASCARALEQGYRQIKLHEITVPAVQAARDAIGPDVALMLDTNCPWSVEEALAMVAALRPFDLHWLEEPVWPPEDHAGLAKVRAAGAVIAAGENAAGLHRVSPRVRARRARCGAAERHQDRRHQRDAPHHRARAANSACASCRIVLISGPASSRACTSRRRCRPTRRSSVSRSIWKQARSATGSTRRTARCACRRRPGSAPIPIRR